MQVAEELLGRHDEIESLERFLERAREGPAALVLTGEAGIGKTALWRVALERAGRAGHRVLATVAVGAEQRLAYAGLADLLEAAVADRGDILPPPQRRALAAALLLEDPGERETDPRTVAAATLSLLRALAADGPVLVAVDDAQWLDHSSAEALSFALRRVRAEPVALLATHRAGTPLALNVDAAEMLEPRALSIGAVQRLLHQTLDATMARPVLRRLHAASSGNPLLALELGRAVQHGGQSALGPGLLPVPERVEELMAGRLAALPAPTLAALRELAARPGAVPAVLTPEALAPALEVGIITLDGARVRFAHPLFQAAVYARTDPWERRALHERLAASAVTAEERAHHLARSTEPPDEHVAGTLEEAAAALRRRGATADSAELYEQALRFTPAADAAGRARRGLCATQAHGAARNPTRLLAVLRDLVPQLPPGPDRAPLLASLGHHTYDTALIEQAVEEANDDAGRASATVMLGVTLGLLGELRASREAARRAVALAESAGDDALLCSALALAGRMEAGMLVGDPEVALERARTLPHEGDHYYAPGAQIGLWRLAQDRLDEARELLIEHLEGAIAVGDEQSRESLLLHLGALEVRAGNLDRALELAQEGLDLAVASGEVHARGWHLYGRAHVLAHKGDLDAARADAEAALELAAEGSSPWYGLFARTVLGFADVTEARYDDALEWIGNLHDLLEALGLMEPGFLVFHADEIEALVGVGQLERAEARLETIERQGRHLDRPAELVVAWRGRGMLLAARGELEAGVGCLERALVECGRLPVPTERARTLLALGAAERRLRRRAAARRHLDEARRVFAATGARAWVARVDAELARIGGRGSAAAGLTATEQRVAELVAAGHSNKEVARLLTVSPKTVDGHLSRIYPKLGVRSRTELARALGQSGGESPVSQEPPAA